VGVAIPIARIPIGVAIPGVIIDGVIIEGVWATGVSSHLDLRLLAPGVSLGKKKKIPRHVPRKTEIHFQKTECAGRKTRVRESQALTQTKLQQFVSKFLT
jgi:hypothetical protein